MTHVISEKVTRTKNIIKGTFRLSNRTTTHFDIRRGESWNQWGNSTDNLGVTVDRVSELEQELLES